MQYNRENRMKVQRSLKRVMRRKQFKSFSTWVEYYNARQGLDSSWESVHNRLVHGKKVSAWRAWTIAIAYMRRMELIVERACPTNKI